MAERQVVHSRALGQSGHRKCSKKIAGRSAFVAYDLSKADVIVSLESDFLNVGPAALVYARQFGARRNPESGSPNRLYAIESSPSVSGSIADHHISAKSSAIPGIDVSIGKSRGSGRPGFR